MNTVGVTLVYSVTMGADTMFSQLFTSENKTKMGIILQRGEIKYVTHNYVYSIHTF